MYQMIRFAHHLLRAGATEGVVHKALVGYYQEQVEAKAERIMHYALNGVKKPTRNGKDSAYDDGR